MPNFGYIFDGLDLRCSFGKFRVPCFNYSFDFDIVIVWFDMRSVIIVMLDTVIPSLLPLDILWLSLLQEGFGVPEILGEIFSWQ